MNGIKNSKLVQSINRLAVLRTIREEGRLSKTELCQAVHLSHPTVSAILDGLCREGFVAEVGYGTSSGGRKPAIFEFRPQARYIIGVDLKRDGVILGVIDLLAAIVERRTFDRLPNVEAVVDGIGGLVNELGQDKVVGIGVGMRGFLDDRTGTLRWVSNARWRNVPLKRMLEERTGCRVYIDHNYNLAALGEQHFGVGQGVRDLVYINVGAGLSAALIINGHLHRGWMGQAGEFGHTVVMVDGAACGCGRRGCLETLVSGTALAEAAGEALGSGADSSLREIFNNGSGGPDGDDVVEAAVRGDALAVDLLRRAGGFLGSGVVNLINLFNPEMVIIGGTIGRTGGVLMDALMEVVEREAIAVSRSDLRVVSSRLGKDAVLVGAATLILENWLQLPMDDMSRNNG